MSGRPKLGISGRPLALRLDREVAKRYNNCITRRENLRHVDFLWGTGLSALEKQSRLGRGFCLALPVFCVGMAGRRLSMASLRQLPRVF